MSLWRPRIRGYALAGVSSLAALLVSQKLSTVFGTHIQMVFLVPILLSAYVGGLGPGLAATGLVALLTDYYILPPAHTLTILHPADGLRWGLLILIGLLISLISEALHRSRRQAEANWRRYAATLASIGDAVITTDQAGRITLLNAEAERLTGWSHAESIGQPLTTVFVILNENTRQSAENPVNKVLQCGGVIGLANGTLLRARDGREIPIEDSGAPIKLGAAEIIGVVLVFRDCSPKRLAERNADQLSQIVAQTRCILNFGEVTGPDGWRERALDAQSPFQWEFPVQNEAAAQMICPLKLAAGERYQQAWSRSRHPDDHAQMNRNSGGAFLNEAPFYRNEFRCADKHGLEHWMQQSVTVRKLSENRWRVFGITTDITDLKKIEGALRESEARFRSYVENAPLAVFVADRTGRFLDCNPAAVQLLGYDLPALKKLGLQGIQSDGERETARQALAELMEHKHLEGEYQFRRRDGKPIWVALRAVMLEEGRFLGFCHDITENKQSKEMQKRLVAAVEQLAEGIIITDAGGQILYVNPAIQKITGYSWEEVIGRNPRMLKSGKHSAAFYEAMWDTLSRGGVWTGRLHNRKKDGSLYQEEATISPLRDATGKITNYVAVKRDVTREMAIEDQLRQSQKMEAIGQLAGGIAHDFNNLLTAICGNASLLLLHPPPAAGEVTDCARQIVEAAERGANLTRQLLMFGRKQIIQTVPLDLNTVVARMTQLLKRILGEDITLVSNHADRLPAIQADPGMMEQILLNLAVNSRDAMPGGGQLLIATGTEILEPETPGPDPAAPAAVHVCLRVSDTGCGITAEHLPHIFEPFFTTKEVGKGTGLGLATVHGIVQQHHGRITVSTEVGRGTTFRIYFPAVGGGKPDKGGLPGLARFPGGTETLLVVEDEFLVRVAVSKMLQRFGYTVLQAESGEAALKLWPQYKDQIRLLLTDVVMPGGLSGYELARQLQAEQPRLKVIYTSGYNGDLAGERPALTDGLNFLQKPYAPQKLAEALRKNLDPG